MVFSPENTSIRLSGRYLRRLEPVKIAVYGLLTYLFITLIAPLQVSVLDPSGMALVYAVLGYVGLAIGAGLYHTLFPPLFHPPILLSAPLPKPLFTTALILSSIGIILRVVDRLVYRGITLGEDSSFIRTQLSETSASAFSVIGAPLYPICYAVIFFYFCLRKQDRSLGLGFWALLLFLYPLAEAITLGLRSQLLICLGLILMTRSFLVDHLKVLHNPIVMILGTLVLFNLVFIIFEIRTDQQGIDFFTSAQSSVYAFTVQPNDFTAFYLAKNSGFMRTVIEMIVHFTQYYCHSGFEYLYIFDKIKSEPLWGGYNFYHIFKFIGILFNSSYFADSLNNLEIRSGVFATFFIPLFVDFNWGGPVVMVFFGFLMSWLWRTMQHHPVAWFPLMAYMNIVLFLLPITSFFFAAQGVYAISALFVIGSIIHHLDRRRQPIIAASHTGH